MADLTTKQQQFIDAHRKGLSATAAYRQAYPNVKSDEAAAAAASRLLRNVKVAAALKQALATDAEQAGTTAARVIEELATLALSDVGDVLDLSGTEPRLRPANQISPQARRAIAAVKVKRYTEGRGDAALEVEVTEFRLWDKNSALDKLCRHLGLYKDMLQVTGKDGGPIPVKHELPSTDAAAALLDSLTRAGGAHTLHANGSA